MAKSRPLQTRDRITELAIRVFQLALQVPLRVWVSATNMPVSVRPAPGRDESPLRDAQSLGSVSVWCRSAELQQQWRALVHAQCGTCVCLKQEALNLRREGWCMQQGLCARVSVHTSQLCGAVAWLVTAY